MKNRLSVLSIGLYITICITALYAFDACLQSVIADTAILRLSRLVDSEGGTLQSRAEVERTANTAMMQRIASLTEVTPLSLDRFKGLLQEHKLVLRSLSRKTKSQAHSDIQQYDTQVTGTIGAVVRFLHDLDTKHTAGIDRLQIVPADDLGREVLIHFWLGFPAT